MRTIDHRWLAGLALLFFCSLALATSVDDGFSTSLSTNFVGAIAVQADGKIIIGGNISSINGQPRQRIGRVHADGSLDTSFAEIAVDNWIYDIAIQADGRIVIAGKFSQVGVATRKGIARLNPDGSFDASFNANIGDDDSLSWAYSLALQPDGKIFVGGGFSRVGGVERRYLARLNVDGSVDMTYTPPLSGQATSG
ncbi:delta-60 repeat domain-containing protein, partial [Dokdonella sp.]|uniref:delta-60 repeat domain-containing protein n=1 Tax=Dokdonella sp. TaxID=2291710 RepID=UPI003C586BB7